MDLEIHSWDHNVYTFEAIFINILKFVYKNTKATFWSRTLTLKCILPSYLPLRTCNRTDEKYAASPRLEPGTLRLQGERSPDWANRAAYTQFTSTCTYPSHSRHRINESTKLVFLIHQTIFYRFNV